MARDAGLLHLDDEVKKYEPRFNPPNPFPSRRGTTLHQLATHLAGKFGCLSTYVDPKLFCFPFRCRLGPRGSLPAAMQCHRCSNLSPNQSGNNCTCAEYQATHSFVQLPLVLPPNTRAAYSNLGFSILGNVLAKALNISYENLIADQIIGPMRFAGTGENTQATLLSFVIFLTLENFWCNRYQHG